MKLTILDVLQKYGDYISKVDLAELLYSGSLKAYVNLGGTELLIPKESFSSLVEEPNSRRLFLGFLQRPTYVHGGEGVSSPSIKFKDTGISMMAAYFKKDEIDKEVMPIVFEPYRFIRKIEDDFKMCSVFDSENGFWVTETYAHGFIIKRLMTCYKENPESRVNIDDLLEEENVKIGDTKISSLFKRKIIRNYIDSEEKFIRFKFPK